MLHEEHLEVAGVRVKLTCRQCQQMTVGQMLRRERRPYYFGVPLGVERQTLVKCGKCGLEYFAPWLAWDTPELSDVDHFLDKVNDPLFPKMLIVLMLISSPLPLIPFFIHFCLRGYRNYIRGPWKMLHRVAFWIAVAALVLWVPFIASQELSQTR